MKVRKTQKLRSGTIRAHLPVKWWQCGKCSQRMFSSDRVLFEDWTSCDLLKRGIGILTHVSFVGVEHVYTSTS